MRPSCRNVRFVQCGCRSGLPAEPFLIGGVVGKLRRQHLQRDDPFGDGVEGPPHLAHAAATQQIQQPIATERCPVLHATSHHE
jgi:hypothetical protein